MQISHQDGPEGPSLWPSGPYWTGREGPKAGHLDVLEKI